MWRPDWGDSQLAYIFHLQNELQIYLGPVTDVGHLTRPQRARGQGATAQSRVLWKYVGTVCTAHSCVGHSFLCSVRVFLAGRWWAALTPLTQKKQNQAGCVCVFCSPSSLLVSMSFNANRYLFPPRCGGITNSPSSCGPEVLPTPDVERPECIPWSVLRHLGRGDC